MKTSFTVRTLLRPLLLTAFLIGCVGQQDSQFQQATPGGKLYISNLGDSSLLIYSNILNAFGPPTPPSDCTLNGTTTTCNLAPTEKIHNLRIQNFILDPLAVFVDTINNRLYVANTGLNQILIYNNASTATGNAVPDRVISGANTTLNAPRGLAMDTINNILYVSDAGSNAILVFDVSDASFTPSSVCTVSSSTTPTTTCNLTPTRTIIGLDRPWGLFADITNNRLYAANTGQSSILVFNNASNSATLTPARTITFSNTNNTLSIPRLSNPSGLFVDTINNRLYVANNGNNSILVFNNTSNINGETIPARAVSGSFTNLADPVGVFADTTQNILYVTDDTNILAFDVSDAAFDTPVVSSTATGGTSTTLTDTSQTFIPNQFVNYIVKITGGTGAGLESLIIGNDTNTLTVSPPWPLNPTTLVQIIPDATSTYEIGPACSISGGTVCNFVPSGTISGTATTLSSPGGIFVDATANVLYAANPGNNSIVVFDNASVATGNVTPDRAILDTGAPLAFPGGIIADVARDILYVAESGSIVVFANASTLNSILPPVTNTISVSPPLFFPSSPITVDTTRDRLYAATSNSILIFNNASTLASPDLPISGLAAPAGLVVDSTRDLLYVSESGTNSIKVFSEASTSPTLFHTIAGPGLVGLRGIAVDTNDILYVVTLTNSILVYDAASTLNGTPTPDRTVSGSMTTLISAFGIFVDPGNNLLYVANSGTNSILVFDNASTVDGNVAPSGTIAQGTGLVNETTLNVPLGVFVDTTR